MTALIRIRFPLDVVARLDVIAGELGAVLKRRVPRAALVRALVKLGVVEPSPELACILEADPVKRGRGAQRAT